MQAGCDVSQEASEPRLAVEDMYFRGSRKALAGNRIYIEHTILVVVANLKIPQTV